MSGPLNGDNPSFVVPSYIQAFRPLAAMSSNKIDEGYSEDTRSQSGSDLLMRMDTRLGDAVGMIQDPQYPLPEWVLSMNETERSEFAHAILRSLRTSSIAGIVEKLNPLLHLDPVLRLPPEITFHIFSYLDPVTLLRASTLSKTWRARVIDSALWRLLFRLEGWNSNFAQVRAFEEAEKARRAGSKGRRTRPRTTEDAESEKPSTKKRVRERPLFGDGASPNTSAQDRAEPMALDGARDGLPNWGEQHGRVEADENLTPRGEDVMEGISYHGASAAATPSTEHKRSLDDDDAASFSAPPHSLNPPVRPSLLLASEPEPKINWQYLYKQKRRLEENWNLGRFSNFQLPHPDHPQERHTECVYTIQYSGKYLVSGSRDKSVRIWNLDTQRLVHPPLQEHTASVLCLQFDERPKEDILITAGSDCRVILWKFSTGTLIRKIEKAHAESVLNLKFDDRYLVTCSKDKKIKVWNRKELLPTDNTYPSSTTKSQAQFPSYIINMQHQVESTHLHFKPLPPYSLLMTMEGHGAAVNAIQIYDGQIVSASGDRNIKIWDVRTGACTRTFSGHTKGIACVQFDGRRIVSGSSDETVRIFDRATGAEVACLQGHSNLVRTVQAQFGDLPGNEEELEAEAKAIDRTFFEAQRSGLVANELSREQRRARNAGSRDPKSIFAYGAKLPPGGGGSRWARIVSGSYDETIIIWKKGPDGAWEKARVLYQNEAARAAGGPRTRVRNRAQGAQAPTPGPNFQALAQQAVLQAAAAHLQAEEAHASSQGLHSSGGPLAGNNQTPAANGGANVNSTTTTTTIQNTPGAGPSTGTQGNQGQAAPQAQAQAQGQNAGQQQPAQPAQPTVAIPPAIAAAAAAANNTGPHHHHHHHHHQHQHHVNAPTSSRVFKLQFDARRIICCSQDPTIVGWDFANNDPDIIQSSQFFGDSG